MLVNATKKNRTEKVGGGDRTGAGAVGEGPSKRVTLSPEPEKSKGCPRRGSVLGRVKSKCKKS